MNATNRRGSRRIAILREIFCIVATLACSVCHALDLKITQPMCGTNEKIEETTKFVIGCELAGCYPGAPKHPKIDLVVKYEGPAGSFGQLTILENNDPIDLSKISRTGGASLVENRRLQIRH